MLSETKPEGRNDYYMWINKKVIKTLRNKFNKNVARNIIPIYMAICELESDYPEGIINEGFVEKIADYSGIEIKQTEKYLNYLKKLHLLDYHKEVDTNSTNFILYEYMEVR